MRITIAHHFPLRLSGSGTYVLNVAAQLMALGHEVEVIAPSHPSDTAYPFPCHGFAFSAPGIGPVDLTFDHGIAARPGHPMIAMADLDDRQLGACRAMWREMLAERMDVFRPEVIHCQHVLMAAVAAADLGLPTVITCHGTDLTGIAGDARLTALAQMAAGHAARVVAVSRDLARRAIADLALTGERVAVIANGFDPEVFNPCGAPARDGGDRRRRVVYAGRLVGYKGIDTLLHAASRYEREAPGTETVIAGSGDLLAELRQLAQRLGLRGVSFVGHLDPSRLAALFRDADVVAVPSRLESFGLVAVEAMACGAPVVAAATGGLPELIDGSVGAVVPADDAGALADALLAELADRRRGKGAAAAVRAHTRYTWAQRIDELLACYAAAAGTSAWRCAV